MGVMHIAIDMDGTLAEHPKEFAQLMVTLLLANNYITILPGSMAPNNEPFRLNQLATLGITEDMYSELTVCYGQSLDEVGQRKGEFCRDRKVDMLFEDMPIYLRYVRSISPQTVCWLAFA